jgi:hypothetical protein
LSSDDFGGKKAGNNGIVSSSSCPVASHMVSKLGRRSVPLNVVVGALQQYSDWCHATPVRARRSARFQGSRRGRWFWIGVWKSVGQIESHRPTGQKERSSAFSSRIFHTQPGSASRIVNDPWLHCAPKSGSAHMVSTSAVCLERCSPVVSPSSRPHITSLSVLMQMILLHRGHLLQRLGQFTYTG